MQKTKKKNIKVRDLKPKKDAKGGVVHRLSTPNSPTRNISHNVAHNVAHN